MLKRRAWIAIVVVVALTILIIVLTSNLPMPSIPDVVNSGFETSETNATPSGWNTNGAMQANYIEADGHTGEFRLTQRGADAYQVETWQTLMNVPNGWYTLRAWVRSSGGQNAAYIALKDCGSAEKRAYLPVVRGGRWVEIVVSNEVTNGQCTIALVSDAQAGNWADFDDIELLPGRAALSIMGADISSLKKSEDKGGVYRYEDGSSGDALDILKAHGLNYARLRVWVDPPDGYHDKAELVAMAQRLASKGIKLLVDFHYSDSWADPGKQIKPPAWQDYTFDQLKQAVYDHTFDVCNALKEAGYPPDMVQVGNEINPGMLWPDGHTDHWDNLAALLKEGYRAVKDCSASTRVMLHLAEGGKNDLARWWFDNAIERDVPFDLIGVSYYPYWHGTLADLQNNLNDITARYDKDVIVVETAYAFSLDEDDIEPNIVTSSLPGYRVSPEGQTAMLRDVMNIVRAVPNGRGLGIFWWDATWTAVSGNGWDPADPSTGNGWENQALFDYDDRPLPAMQEFNNP